MTKLEKACEYVDASDGIDYPEDIEILKKNPEIAKLDDRVVQILWSAWSDCLYAGWLMVYPTDGDFFLDIMIDLKENKNELKKLH